MTKELHKMYRPRNFDEFVGNDAAVKLLQGKLASDKFPHAILLCGPTGCGKTTLARILRKELQVHKSDFIEMNASNERGIEMIRNLANNTKMSSLRGGNKIYLMDECFVAGTKVSTPEGVEAIEDVCIGDIVHNMAGTGKVTATFKKEIPLNRLVKITFSDGRFFFCSDGHEIMTHKGWVRAKDLLPGDLTYSKLSDMMLNSKSLNGGNGNENVLGVPKAFDEETKAVLFQELSGKEQSETPGNTSKTVLPRGKREAKQDQNGVLQNGEREGCGRRTGHSHEEKESHVESRNSGEDACCEGYERHSSRMEGGTRGERETDGATNPTFGDIKMAHGSSYCDGKSGGISPSLQSGCGEHPSESGSGNRWTWSLIEEQFVERQKEAGSVGIVGVESVTLYQRGSNDKDFLGVVGDTEKREGFVVLYDFSVDSHPSYFAEGVAVHNCHQLTKPAQEALLKVLEDTPKHVYFILATTDPQNLGKAILSRCTTIKLEALPPRDIKRLINEIAEAEETALDAPVADEISRLSDGLPREAVKLLDAVLGMDTESALKALASIKTSESTIKDLCKELLGQARWKVVQPMLTNLCVDPEGSRLAILGYLSACALRECDGYLVALMACFSDNYYPSGRAGLIIDAYNACGLKNKKG